MYRRGIEERRQVKEGKGYRRWMKDRWEVRIQMRDGREERGEGYRRWMEERREVRDTGEGLKRGRR